MKSLTTIILLTFLISNNLLAADSVLFLAKDKPSPYDGYLFTEEKTKELKNKLIDYDFVQQINQSLTRSLDLYKNNEQLSQEKMNLCMTSLDKTSEALHSAQRTSDLERVLLFGAGVVATIAVIFGVKAATK